MTIFSKLFAVGRTTLELSVWLNMPEKELRRWKYGPPDGYTYATFQIPKKKKGEFRTIDAPNEELRKLQRLIYHKLLRPLSVHESAKGFVPKKSIVHNALPHLQQAVVINLDLKDFFPSISARKVHTFWRSLGWGEAAATILTRMCCTQSRLPQGAPTSPALSNLVNRKLDARLFGLVSRSGGTYTRYADDIVLSFPVFGAREKLALSIACKIIKDEGYTIQKKKRVRVQRPHQRQTVTGLVVNKKVNFPRELRRRIRAMEHHESLDDLNKEQSNELKGYQALVRMIEQQTLGYKIPDRKILPEQPKPKKDYRTATANVGLVKLLRIIAVLAIFAGAVLKAANKPTDEFVPSNNQQCPAYDHCGDEKMDIEAVVVSASGRVVPKVLSHYQRWSIALGAMLIEMNGLPHDKLTLSDTYYDQAQKKQVLQELIKDSWNITDRASTMETLSWLANEGHARDFYLPVYLLIKDYPTKSTQELVNIAPTNNLSEEDKSAFSTAIEYIKTNKDKTGDNLIYAWDWGRFVFIVRVANYSGYISDAEALTLIEEVGERVKGRFHSWQEFGNNYTTGRLWWGLDKPEIPVQTKSLNDGLMKPTGQWGKIKWEWSQE